MSETNIKQQQEVENSKLAGEYQYGFTTDIETETIPKGINEDVVRLISSKKKEPEWMTEWRLAAYRHFLTMPMPNWAKLQIAAMLENGKAMSAPTALLYAGQPSTFSGELTFTEKGAYVVDLYAYDPANGNTGLVKYKVTVR